MMGDITRGGFIYEAERLLRAGKPHGALQYLYRYSDNLKAPRTPTFWRLRAACVLLSGGETSRLEGISCLEELPGASSDDEFLELYVASIEAIARRRTPYFVRRKIRRQSVIEFNIRFAAEVAGTLGKDAETLQVRLTAIQPEV